MASLLFIIILCKIQVKLALTYLTNIPYSSITLPGATFQSLLQTFIFQCKHFMPDDLFKKLPKFCVKNFRASKVHLSLKYFNVKAVHNVSSL